MIINKDLILDLVHPIGSIYISIDSTSPATLFGGTWTQITNDAYLKIVSSNAGNLGGTSSDHKIPVSSIPAHYHDLYDGGGNRLLYWDVASLTGIGALNSGSVVKYSWASKTKNTGGGKAYYPYYYGVYVWKRTA